MRPINKIHTHTHKSIAHSITHKWVLKHFLRCGIRTMFSASDRESVETTIRTKRNNGFKQKYKNICLLVEKFVSGEIN